MKISSKRFDKEVGKDPEMVTDMNIHSGEVFLKEVRATLRTERWAGVCEESERGFQEEVIFHDIFLIFELMGLGTSLEYVWILIFYFV